MLRDTETEEMLRSYETPLARAAGPGSRRPRSGWCSGPRSTPLPPMAMAARTSSSSPASCCGCKTPNELIGVMAHETGHISAGHLSRGSYGMKKAMIPMLLSMVVGVAAMIAGAGEAGMAIMGIGQAYAMGQMAAFTRVQESTADQIAAKLLLATHQSPMGMYHTFQRFAHEEAHERLQDRQVRGRPSRRARTASSTSTTWWTPRPIAKCRIRPQVAAHLPDGAGQAGGLRAAGEGSADPLSGIATPPSRRAMPAPWSICASPTSQGAGRDRTA